MDDSAPNYETYSPDELRDAARRINREKYPETWKLLQAELAKRSIPPTDDAETAPEPGRLSYTLFHVVVCPIVALVVSAFLERDANEGQGCLTSIAVPLAVLGSLLSALTYPRFLIAKNRAGHLAATVVTFSLGGTLLIFGPGLVESLVRALRGLF